MEFKLYYNDDKESFEFALQDFSENGYEHCTCDRAHCASMEFIPNNSRYWLSTVVFRDAGNRVIYDTTLSYWHNFALFFDDGTSIVLSRDFDPHLKSQQNFDMINDFVDKVHRKLTGPVLKLAQDEVEFMDI